MNARNTLFASLAALCVAAPAFAADSMSSTKSDAKTYAFVAQSSSGETGTVTLQPDGDATTVTIALSGAPAAAQPAHIHPGTCAKLDPSPKYPLSNVVDGKSTTTVKASISALTTGGFAVNVHKSTNDLATYVACADLSSSNMATPAPGKM